MRVSECIFGWHGFSLSPKITQCHGRRARHYQKFPSECYFFLTNKHYRRSHLVIISVSNLRAALCPHNVCLCQFQKSDYAIPSFLDQADLFYFRRGGVKKASNPDELDPGEQDSQDSRHTRHKKSPMAHTTRGSQMTFLCLTPSYHGADIIVLLLTPSGIFLEASGGNHALRPLQQHFGRCQEECREPINDNDTPESAARMASVGMTGGGGRQVWRVSFNPRRSKWGEIKHPPSDCNSNNHNCAICIIRSGDFTQ